MVRVFLVLTGGSPCDLDEGNELVNINYELRHGTEFSTANAWNPKIRGGGFQETASMVKVAWNSLPWGRHVGFFSSLVPHVHRRDVVRHEDLPVEPHANNAGFSPKG